MGSEEVSFLGGLKGKFHELRGRSLAKAGGQMDRPLMERIMLYDRARKNLRLAGWDDKTISAFFDIA